MRDLIALLQAHTPATRIAGELDAGNRCYAEGLWGSSAAYLTAAIATQTARVHVCLTPTVEQAETFYEDLELFAPGLAMPFPAWEAFDEDEYPDAEILSQRLAVLKRLYSAQGADDETPLPIIVAPIQAALQPTPSPQMLKQNAIELRPNLEYSPESLSQWLVERDFQSVRRVEVPGEFCRRGGILDIFPYTADMPVRIEFFGDVIDSIRTFDPATQDSDAPVARIPIAAIPRHVMGRVSKKSDAPGVWSSLFDHLPRAATLVLKEPAELLDPDRIRANLYHLGAARACRESLNQALSLFPSLHMAALPGVFGRGQTTFHVHSVERFGQDIQAALKELEVVTAERKRTILFCNNDGEKQRLEEMLSANGVQPRGHFEIRIGRLNQAFDWADLSLAMLTHHELFRRYRQRRTTARYRHTKAVDSFYDLQVGDLVVHAVQGIGIFRGMELLDHGDDRQECLRLEYADKAFLYVPASRVELVQKYIGPSEHRPPLSKLGAKGWLRRKEQAENAVRDLAAELLRLQAVRALQRGIVHPVDNEWQKDFEAAFPYEETVDQLRVADEVKRDMEETRPMDRLICGDVGYGKTEIAMRGAFKSVMGGRQVAVLVPTTILAMQHAETFRERMADYPVEVRMLSRFLTRGQQGDVLERLANGQVDIIIGTHRLVQKDVHFKNLGMVIIDEEQRFGVEHKERLKQLRETVDVLTLTATPIPRTLHMSLLGIRDIATLETPPRDRLAIHTRLMRYDPHKIRQAILHEMSRGGQVFFLHNRVASIDRVASELRALVPEATILVGHGQMPERKLAEVMRQFVDHKADVLCCTTIIESGLDIPNVNTIMINRADMFGLAELHQLRGRVGRYKHRAYAYMLLPPDRPVTPVAEKRLKAIEEFCELGAGFRIAMRDLEIRGAGNILGSEQSGHIAAVGYDMYCRLLEQAVRGLKAMPSEERPEVSISIGLAAFLPDDYVPDPGQRIDFYRKLQRATHPEDIELLLEALRDRYGALPPPALNLLAEARMRLLAAKAAIASVVFHDGILVLQSPDCDHALRILRPSGHTVRHVDARTVHLHPPAGRDSSECLLSFLANTLEKGLQEKDDAGA